MTRTQAEKLMAGWIPAFPVRFLGGKECGLFEEMTGREVLRWTPDTKAAAFQRLLDMPFPALLALARKQ